MLRSSRSLGLSLLAALTVGALAAPSFAVDSLLAYDGFGNGPLADLHGSQGGTGWNGAWADVMGDVVTNIGGPGLTYPALASTRGAARSLSSDSIYPIARYWRSFGALPSGTTTLYVSFLMKSDESFGWGGLLFGNWPQAMIVGVPAGMGNFGLQLSQGLGDDSTVPLNAGETYLCVVKIVKNAQGSGSTWRLYVNPTVGSAEPGFPTAQYQGPALPTALNIENGGTITTDEIRVGTSWSAVLPTDACPFDLDEDGVVASSDLALVLGGWGTSSPDLTGDGLVNAADIAQLIGAWGACP
jgi:hypothetical protein